MDVRPGRLALRCALAFGLLVSALAVTAASGASARPAVHRAAPAVYGAAIQRPGRHRSAKRRHHRRPAHAAGATKAKHKPGHPSPAAPIPVSTVAPTAAPSPTAPLPFLHTSGTQIVDTAGNPVSLQGVDLGGWLLWEGWMFGGGYTGETAIVDRLATLVGMPAAEQFHAEVQQSMIQESDIAQIASLGFNVIRVPFDYRLLEDPGFPGVYKASGWAILDNLVQWAQENHVYIVLDMHAAPGGQALGFTADNDDPTGPLLWNSPQDQADMVAMWQAIAARYANDSAIAGYDLLNEPYGSPTDPPPGLGVSVPQIYARTIAAIRSVDPNHMIFLEGARDSRDFSWATTPMASNIVYSPHMYLWSQTDVQAQLDAYAQMADAQQVPLWIGEYGENLASQDAAQVAMFKAQSAVAGWSFWTWKETNGLGVYRIPVSADWQMLINWLCSSTAPAPTVAQATQGMQDFVSDVALGNDTPSPAVISALSPLG